MDSEFIAYCLVPPTVNCANPLMPSIVVLRIISVEVAINPFLLLLSVGNVSRGKDRRIVLAWQDKQKTN